MTEPIVSRRSKGLLIGILLLVNSAAIWGQAGWALDHIVPAKWDWRAGLALSLGFAAALELIGVFLATMADEAEMRHQPAGGIRLGSYAVGLVSGALNLSHWGVWTAAAFAFGFLSAVSPFLWGIYSRVRRGRPIAPSRRFWHPIRSTRLIRHMAWYGLTDELAAIDAMPTAAASAPPDDADEPEVGADEPEDRAGRKVRQDARSEQDREAVVCAMRAADPKASLRQISAATLVPVTTVRNILSRAAAQSQPPKKINGSVPDLEGANR